MAAKLSDHEATTRFEHFALLGEDQQQSLHDAAEEIAFQILSVKSQSTLFLSFFPKYRATTQ